MNNSAVAPFLVKHIERLKALGENVSILDLACGSGRNGLYVAAQIPGSVITFVDRSTDALTAVQRQADEKNLTVSIWPKDLEGTDSNPLAGVEFDAILVFRYLHRPLIPVIRTALRPGGLLIYETFTVDQPKFGRPTNPDFLLKKGELSGWFNDWDIIEYEEIIEQNCRAIAHLICRKPECLS